MEATNFEWELANTKFHQPPFPLENSTDRLPCLHLNILRLSTLKEFISKNMSELHDVLNNNFNQKLLTNGDPGLPRPDLGWIYDIQY